MTLSLTGTTIAVITVSDRVSGGHAKDRSGPILADAFGAMGAHVIGAVVPDGPESVAGVIEAAIAEGAKVVVTTGGTGIGPRDLTPEGTRGLIAKELPGVAERLRQIDAQEVPTSVLSRGLAGVTASGAVVVNVAGSAGAAMSAAKVLATLLPHVLSQLAGGAH
jgi:molybdenum cofactor synthesis domain-containing protein